MPTLREYRGREHWSASSINQFLNICSLQYAFQRVYREIPAFTPVCLVFGTVYHQVMRHAALVRMEGGRPEAGEGRELFAGLWRQAMDEARDGDRDVRLDQGMGMEDYLRQGQDLVACAIAETDPEERIVSVDEAFAVPLLAGGVQVTERPLIGELDLVIEKNGQRMVVDHKTSARRWSKGQAALSIQPTAYLYAYRQLHGMEVPFRFDVLVKHKTPVRECHHTTRDDNDFERLAVLAGRIEAMVEAGHFLPSDQGFYCGGCPYRKPCARWHMERGRVCKLAA